MTAPKVSNTNPATILDAVLSNIPVWGTVPSVGVTGVSGVYVITQSATIYA